MFYLKTIIIPKMSFIGRDINGNIDGIDCIMCMTLNWDYLDKIV